MCQWSQCVDTGAPLLLLAGKQGLVKVIDILTETFVVVRNWGPSGNRARGKGGEGKERARHRLLREKEP